MIGPITARRTKLGPELELMRRHPAAVAAYLNKRAEETQMTRERMETVGRRDAKRKREKTRMPKKDVLSPYFGTGPLISCQCHKKLYPNKKQVQSIAKQRALSDGENWNFYKCPFRSGFWHLGHPNGREAKTREDQRTRIETSNERSARMRNNPNLSHN